MRTARSPPASTATRPPATARPASAGAGVGVPVAIARLSPAPLAALGTAPDTQGLSRPAERCAERGGGAEAADGAERCAERAEGGAAPPAAPPSGALGSVAKRLAAAKANPQLGKMLDPNSVLADNYSLLGVLGKGSYSAPCPHPGPPVRAPTAYMRWGSNPSDCAGVWPTTLYVEDTIQIPEDIEAGEYVLGWRWDCEETTQIWQSCSDITIA